MKNKCRIFLVLFLACSVFALMQPVMVLAENSTTKGSLAVTPAQLSLVVNPSSSQTMGVKLTNTYDADLHLVAELHDIDDSSIRLAPAGSLSGPLADAIKLSATDVTVPAHGSYELKVVVSDQVDLADGGHYASLVLAERPTSGVSSTFRSAVAVTMFIIKNQNIRNDLRVTDMNIEHTLLSLPKLVTVQFTNLGNAHIVPRGSILLYDGDTVVGKAVLNVDSQILLPGKENTFTASFDTYKNIFFPRKLYAQLTYRIDGEDIQLIKRQSFWYVPIVDPIIFVILCFCAWRYHAWIRRFARKTWQSIRTLYYSKKRRRGMKTSRARRSTKRMLGRTVIRSHRVATTIALRRKASKILGPPAVPRAKRIPVARQISVKVTEELPLAANVMSAETSQLPVRDSLHASGTDTASVKKRKTTKPKTKKPTKMETKNASKNRTEKPKKKVKRSSVKQPAE